MREGLSRDQKLRSLSYPLQRWQWDLSAFEDETLLEFPPRHRVVESLTLHNEVSHQTQRNVMFLGSRLDWGRIGSTPPVAYLTGFQTQLALQDPEDFLHLLPVAIMRSPGSEFVPQILLSTAISSDSTCT